MSQYADREASDEDADNQDSENEEGGQAQGDDNEADEDARINARIGNLLPKKREIVLRTLARGGNGDASFGKANAKDLKWVLDIIAKDDVHISKLKQKKTKSNANTPKKRVFNAYNEDGGCGSGGEGGGDRDKEQRRRCGW